MRPAVIFLFMPWSIALPGQTQYAKLIQHPGNPLYARISGGDVAADGKVVTLGQAELGSTLAVFDSMAVPQWAERFAPASVNVGFLPLQVHWMPNHDILLTGYVDSLPFRRYPAMMRLDPDGNVLWTQAFGIGDGQYASSRSIVLDNGDIAFLSIYANRLGLSRFDGTGQHLWSRVFPEVWVDDLTTMALEDFGNGDLLVRYRSVIVRLDQAGSVLYGWSFEVPGTVTWPAQVYFPKIGVLADGGFVLQAIVDYYPALIRFDVAANVVWAKKYDYGDYYQPWFTSIIELPSGELLAFPMSGWNRTIGLRIDADGDPIVRTGVEESFRLWPGSPAYWPQQFVGVQDGAYHFIGTVQQVVNGGFTPERTGFFRLDENLTLPCVSVNSPFTSEDILTIPAPNSIDSSLAMASFQWSFPYALQPIAYGTEEACPLILSVAPVDQLPALRVFPSVVGPGQTVFVAAGSGSDLNGWEFLDLSGRAVARGTFVDRTSPSLTCPSTCASGIHVLRVTDDQGAVLGCATIVLE